MLTRLCLLLLLSTPGMALAGSFTVAPVRVQLAAGQRATSVTLTNVSAEPQRIQAEALRWTREGGEDVYHEDAQLLLNPPLFELAPGASQIVRLGFRPGAVPPADRESAFRVYFQEVPKDKAPQGPELRLVLRIGVPVFVAPAQPAGAQLDWSAGSEAAGQTRISLTNRGDQHTRISDLKLSQAAMPPAKADGFTYVFPGETYSWLVQTPALSTGRAVELDALTDQGPVHVQLPATAH
ncbi:MAG TPA: fimbria/pilus periplasmic chaperone [Solimonas sp.]|nr:fimbria/pilus periplasmic chaperone [Solimonas sp.]